MVPERIPRIASGALIAWSAANIRGQVSPGAKGALYIPTISEYV